MEVPSGGAPHLAPFAMWVFPYFEERHRLSTSDSARPRSCTGRGEINVSTRAKKRAGSRIRVEKSSGNVFADLGLPHPEQELLKAKLTLRIYRLIKRRGVTQAEAGKIRSGASSVERLMDFIIALGQDVQITVRPTRKPHGEVSVVA